jgi:hypothetical protein
MRFCYYLVVSLLLLSPSGDAHAQQQQYRPAPVYRPAPRVYRPAPIYRPTVPNRPQVVRPPTAHGPLNASPHPVHPVTNLHSYAHGTGPHWHHHGHFNNGSWVSDPGDPPYEGDVDAPDDDVGEDADEATTPSGGGAQYGAIAVGRINGNVSSGWATRGNLKPIVLRSILAAKLRVRVVASYIAHGMAVAAMWPLPTTTKAIAPVDLTTRTSR